MSCDPPEPLFPSPPIPSPPLPSLPLPSHRYGRQYIDEAFLYHIVRRDIRHNFSVYFYMLYLVERTPYATLVGALAFLPQAVLVVAAGGVLYRDPPLSWFVQTVLFVTFNKVCTSQVSLSSASPFLLVWHAIPVFAHSAKNECGNKVKER